MLSADETAQITPDTIWELLISWIEVFNMHLCMAVWTVLLRFHISLSMAGLMEVLRE